MSEKSELRRRCREQRRSLKQLLPQDWYSADLGAHLSSLIQNNQTWASYQALDEEMDPSYLQRGESVRWVFPKVVDGDLQFYQTEKFESGAYQVREPAGGELIAEEKIDGVLVPGVAFDRKGTRLGMGKGFYDRSLKKMSAVKVGVTFSELFLDELPSEEHDVGMDYVVTEKFVYSVKEQREL